MQVKPIGVIHSPFRDAAWTPIQPSLASGAQGHVEVFREFEGGLKDLAGFERIWLLYWFDRASEAKLQVTPYLDNTERGLFATRAPCRPNPIGLSCVKLLGVEGCKLTVADIDILDETPLLDIKPYSPKFDHFEVTKSGWLDNATGRTVADDRFYNGQARRNEP
jgi:tRNA-Thr(GGU) m(6)t(6)A37 methyltransferase TsaA